MRSNGHILIRRLEHHDLDAHLELQLRNREYLRPFEPIRPERFYTREGQKETIDKLISNWESDTGYGFGIFLTHTGELIGRVNLSNVVRGAWQNCTIGYFIDQRMQGLGFMTEAVKLAVRFAFEEASLHRVQAAVMPRNLPSIRVVEKAGFRFEGLAKRYLQINGVWEDHNIYAVTREEWFTRL
jgi:[ribosomal protein S5]-alanine N-acetyltransferase